MHVLLAVYVALGTWFVWTCASLHRNYRTARTTKLPIILSPTALLNPFWIVTYKLFPSIIPLVQCLPFGLGQWARYSYLGWEFDDKAAVHKKLGPAFVLCAPGANEVIVADPLAVYDIFSKRKDFIKPAMMYDGLNAFGRNLNTAEGELWQKHRKITAPNFNERVSSSVWVESLRQAEQMLLHWSHATDVHPTGMQGSREVVEDTASLTLNVFTYAGFGVRYAFRDAKASIEHPHRLSYRDSLYVVLRNFTLLAMLPMSLLSLRVMPQSVQKVGQACDEFKLYMKEMVDREKKATTSEKEAGEKEAGEKRNLLASLVQASQAEGKLGLSDEELYGNLFIYNMAGHESTANTVATSVAYLAVSPRWQDWIHEEIQSVCKDLPPTSKGTETWSYDDIFPRLKRCHAVMLETLRLHGSTVFLPKSTPSDSAKVLTIEGVEHVIPAGTFVTINSQALHCDTKTWGADALQWRPDRWIINDLSSTNDVKNGQEVLFQPMPGTFVGWADGPRVCPGRKFSQVEFVAVMSVLFRDHQVRPLKAEPVETDDQTRRRLQRMIDNSAITDITLQMRRPQDVALMWTRRVG